MTETWQQRPCRGRERSLLLVLLLLPMLLLLLCGWGAPRLEKRRSARGGSAGRGEGEACGE